MKIKLLLAFFHLFIWTIVQADNFADISGVKFDEVATDSIGSVYAAGRLGTEGWDMDPSPFNEVELVAAGDENIVVVKYSSKGDLVWHKVLGNNGGIFNLTVTGIAVDPTTQDVVLTGTFHSQTDFNPGAGAFFLNAPDSTTGFILRLNNNGDFIWAKQIGGTTIGEDDGSTRPNDVIIDQNGNILITGTYGGTCDFNPSFIQFNKTAVGSRDMFVLKLSSTGSFSWVHTMECSDLTQGASATSIAVDQYNNMYITGYFNNIVDFSPGQPGFGLESFIDEYGNHPDTDIFVLKLNSLGAGVWVKKIGGSLDDRASSIVCSFTEPPTIIFGGTFRGLVDFDPAPGAAHEVELQESGSIPPIGYEDDETTDGFISRWSSDGDYFWVQRIGSLNNDDLVDIAIHRNYPQNDDDIYYTGRFWGGEVDLDPTSGVYEIYEAASVFTSTYVIKVKVNFPFQWAQAFLRKVNTDAESVVGPRAITVDNKGAPIVVGTQEEVLDFDPGIGSALLDGDGFCVKLDATNGLLRANSAKFDNSLDTDILFQNKSTGSSEIWLMDGVQKLQGGINIEKAGFVASTNWQIEAVADFNKDLQSDVVMQNRTNGVTQIWLLNSVVSNKVTVKSTLSLATVDPNWKVVAAGEFNNDGHTDIVWQNIQSGICVIWFMYKATPYDDAFVTALPTEWQVVGTGWFDNNEATLNTDLIWQNKITKERVIWSMNGAIPQWSFSFGSLGNWEFVGSGFFNEDSLSDLILENKGTQQRTVWFTNPIQPIYGQIPIGAASPLLNFSSQWEVKNR